MNKLILPLLIGIPLVLGAAWIFLAGGKSGIASTRIEVVGPGFSAPIECVDPANCVIQNHFDLAEFAGVSDPSCGDRSYDGHGGLDFRILDRFEMEMRELRTARHTNEGNLLTALDLFAIGNFD